MARRSPRLTLQGHQHCSEDGNKHSFSYRETPVRNVFNKRNKGMNFNLGSSSQANGNGLAAPTPIHNRSSCYTASTAPLVTDSSYSRVRSLWARSSSIHSSLFHSQSVEMANKAAVLLITFFVSCCIFTLVWFILPSLPNFTSRPPAISCPSLNMRLQSDLKHAKKGLDSVEELHDDKNHFGQRITALEDRISMLQQQIQSGPAQSPTTHLTPDIDEAMPKGPQPDIVKEPVRACGSPLVDRMPDFALESLGASIVSKRSEKYYTRCWSSLGIPFWCPSASPQTLIQGHPLLAGRCWPFQGAQATLVVALSQPTRITHITLEHLPVSQAPSGNINSAPKDFSLYGLSSQSGERTFLGTFEYNKNAEPTQTFQLPNPTNSGHSHVEIHILSNWGHQEYTCVYRVRVHGHTASSSN
ncbi:hypothetical protein UPYG_G00189680 [Umbra pygmaea]|uniref:SUN domain-containing protein n=1 Tax=Umbra pygmaea TaxID=75934 RepID=A0ABD0XDF5_UMBPY